MPLQARFRALTFDTRKFTSAIKQVESDVIDHQVQWAKGIIQELQAYPPVPSNSTYQRTGTLGAGWDYTPKPPQIHNSGLNIYVVNRVSYATYVQGPFQVWYHARTGWKQLDKYLDRRQYRSGLMAIYKKFASSVL